MQIQSICDDANRMNSNKGVVRGSQDYEDIANLFRNKTCRKGSYDSEHIRNSNETWRQKHNPQTFAWSVRNIVSSLYLQVPLINTRETEAKTMENFTGMPPPNAPNMSPSGEHIITTAMLWKTPQHDVQWVDSSSNQNSRLTVYTQLLPGKTEKHCTARVEGQGSQLLLQHKWPEEFLSAELLMKSHRAPDGSDYYGEGHSKIVAFKDHVKLLCGGKSDATVMSENRSHLMHPVEEQLPKSEVPNSIYFGNLKGKSGVVKVLAVELMGVRTNYETRKVEKEFEWSQGTSATAAAEASTAATATAAAEAAELRQRLAVDALARQRLEQAQNARRLQEQAEEQQRHEEWLQNEASRLAEAQRKQQEFLSEERRRTEASYKAQYEEQLLQERQRMQQEFFGRQKSETTVVGGRISPPTKTRPMPKVVDQDTKRLHRHQSLKERQDNSRAARVQEMRNAAGQDPREQGLAALHPQQQPAPDLSLQQFQQQQQLPNLQSLQEFPFMPQQHFAALPQQNPLQQESIALPPSESSEWELTAGPKTTGEDDAEMMGGRVSDDELEF